MHVKKIKPSKYQMKHIYKLFMNQMHVILEKIYIINKIDSIKKLITLNHDKSNDENSTAKIRNINQYTTQKVKAENKNIIRILCSR